MVRALEEDYGNPSSLHGMGARAEQAVRAAREAVARTLRADEKEIVFTSGGTESNNLALLGAAYAKRRSGAHIVTTAIEHPSVREPLMRLREEGFEVTELPVDERGVVSLSALSEAVREDTVLVSVMMVNNEIGTLEPVEEAARIAKSKNPGVLFHVDAIQAYGKYRICPRRAGIDLLSASGHKVHAAKGVGFLYVAGGVRLLPVLYGGGQQGGLRSGTENVPGIVSMGAAAEEAYEDFDEKIERLYSLRERLVRGVLEIPGVTVNGPLGREGAPHIVSVSAEGVRSEVLLHALEERGVYVSAGSACSSNKPAPSRTLQGIGLSRELASSTIRISMSARTTEGEVDYAVSSLKEAVPVLRRYSRK